jgi:glycosyltransferase involved in cell wall biosynthesis
MLAPPWIPVPPPAYGGIEAVVDLLCRGLADRGHLVTLFAPPGSAAPPGVELVEVLEDAYAGRINYSLVEADHASCCFDLIDTASRQGSPFDVVHDHSGYVALATADRIRAPLVHTLHGPIARESVGYYRRHGGKALLVALSRNQLASVPGSLPNGRVIPNPIDCSDWPCNADKDDYVVWLGRMYEGKGPHRAIAAAAQAGVRLVLAGPVQPGQEEFFESQIAPQLGSGALYVGEVDASGKRRLLSGARGLLMPITWPEPFGMVMTEALACGTPVIAFDQASARDIVVHEETGFLVQQEEEMAVAIGRLGEIDPLACRRDVERRFDVESVAGLYEDAYRDAIQAPGRPDSPPDRRRNGNETYGDRHAVGARLLT